MHLAKRREFSCAMVYSLTEVIPVPDPPCKHEHTRLIARDDESCFVECVACGEILESSGTKDAAAKDKPGFDESLSDA